MTTFPRLAAFALLAGLVAGCSSGGWGDYVAAEGSQKPAAPLTVEQLSAKVGCTPKMQVEADDLRTGYCKTEAGQFFVNTFASEKLKDEWMDRAPEYNPHLVGPRWTVLGPLEVLEQLKGPLNGDLHLTDHRVSQTPVPR
ncbi:hypothetical protein FH608_026830 [Nonomuraea phyllanthi]|uniref:Uncharacterized protein n=1 Tax=Nonomuraea phyllanthi TaxID=2219224 RepID=A0A5C4W999_9ACTN|nr:hypothetical protein [Nonomuraea phyllanthi]KAB8192297.1 hypothetical protein FH608_026830 [Nonomuraea phyllanthi]QFY11348.1 hypothetical protein GBF35_36465 [Nonomuraea phyllanthi]